MSLLRVQLSMVMSQVSPKPSDGESMIGWQIELKILLIPPYRVIVCDMQA